MFKDAIYHLLIAITKKTEMEYTYIFYLCAALIGDRRYLDALAAAFRLLDMEPKNSITHRHFGDAYYHLMMLDLA